jgi:voltage-gated potassium channel
MPCRSAVASREITAGVKVRQEESGRVRTQLELVVLGATLALIPILILETDASGGWHRFAVIGNWVIWGLFAVELVVIVVGADRKGAAIRAHALDVAGVVVTVPLFGKFLSWVRLARLARLIRLVRVGMIVWRAIRAERRLSSGEAFRALALATVFVVVVSGAAQATFDSGDFPSVWSGIWWAVVTVTTVGYGDLYPKSVGGRLIGIAIMLVGIGFLSVLTAAIASYFVKTDTGGSNEVLQRLDRIEKALLELRAASSAPASD